MINEDKEVLEYIKEAFRLRSENLYKPAVEMLYKALNLDNDNIEILYQIGELYILMKNNTKALSYLERVLSKNPGHIECLKLVSKIYTDEFDYENALIYTLKVYELEKNSKNLSALIKIYGNLNKLDKIADFRNSEFCDADVIFNIANLYYSKGKVQEAEDCLQGCEQTEDIKILLGKILFDKNEFEKSREIFDSFDKNTENPDVLNYKGLFALEDMDFVQAIKCFSKASNINKDNPVYFYNLANAYFFNGWMKEAQESYTKAIFLAPDNMDYRYSLAYLYYSTGSFNKCKKEVEAILSILPEYSRAKVLKALLLNENKNYMQAKEILEDNLKHGFDDDFTLISLGKTYSELDMFKKAEDTLQKVIDRNPQNLDYISDLSDVYIKEKLYDKAFDLAKKVTEQNPNYIYGYVLAAKSACLMRDLDTAKHYAQEAISLDMNCSDGYYYLALVRTGEKDYEEAIECMKRAITYNAANPEYYAQMSNIYREQGDIKTALEYISEAENICHSAEYQDMYKELANLNRNASRS